MKQAMMTNMLTRDDFTPDQWDALCYARLHKHVGMWYRLLRNVCGYTYGRHYIKMQMEAIVDQWLREHPTWAGRYMTVDDVERVIQGREE